jgi:hypothetical protein
MYAFAQIDVLISDDLSGEIAAGAGPAVGIIWRITPRWNAQLKARASYLPGELNHALIEYSLEQNFALSRDWGLRLSAGQQGVSNDPVTDLRLSLNRYF